MRPGADLHRRRLPLRLVLVDAAGAVLAAVGILDLLETGPELLPAAWPQPLAAVSLLVIGCVMMAAVPVWLLRHRRQPPRHRPGA
ncbi:hypothetical protein [Thioalkalivibrio sp. XN8]|uniref:hypothetical protein n=1 Tax=Thioalkalivibrio sp. XN8 TaxID=2712863 RepID=UPI0013EBBF34|nr:hypothetical protein [Thioalkalivibrio sp. XN8]NGP54111.1 hypothetical protein [Thioalkalivibrio sp. XN8]